MSHQQNTPCTPNCQLSNPALPSSACLSLCPARSSLSGCSPALGFGFGKFNIASVHRELLARSWSCTHTSVRDAGPEAATQIVHSRSLQTCASTKPQKQHPNTLPPFEGFIFTSRSYFIMHGYGSLSRDLQCGGRLAAFLVSVQPTLC